MSNNSGPNFCRRSARSRNVSESSESSCRLGSDSQRVVSSSRQFTCPTDSGSLLDNNSPDKIKRKKRRKNENEFIVNQDKNIINKGVMELTRREEEMIRVKLKDNRIPIVLLTRLKNNFYSELNSEPKVVNRQIKNHEELKADERLQLSGLSIPAKIDPKILNHGLVVKINKKQTENLIKNKRLQRQSKPILKDFKQLGKNGNLVVDSVVEKCAERLTFQSDSCSSDDNKCTKNLIVSNSGRRRVQVVDKSNNDRFPESLVDDKSKCLLNSLKEVSDSVNQLDNTENLIHNSKRCNRYSIDQNNFKSSVELVETKPKCTVDAAEDSGDKHSINLSQNIKKCSNKLMKNIEKNPQETNEKSSKKYAKFVDDIDKKSALLSTNDNKGKQPEVICEKIKQVFKSPIEINTRPKRNLLNKNSEKQFDAKTENNSSEILLEIDNEKLSEKVTKIMVNDSCENQTESHSIIKTTVTNHNLEECSNESKFDCTKKTFEEQSKKLSKKLDKKIECSKSETDNNKRITRKLENKKEKRDNNIMETSVNFVKTFNKESEKLQNKIDESVEKCTRNETEKSKKSTVITSVENVKIEEDGETNDINESNKDHTRNLQNADFDVSNNLKKLSENNRRSRRIEHNVINFAKESSENNSKNLNDKVEKISKKFAKFSVERTSETFSNNFCDKLENICNKSSNECSTKNKCEKLSKNIDEKIVKVVKISVEKNKQLKPCTSKSSEKLSEISGIDSSNVLLKNIEDNDKWNDVAVDIITETEISNEIKQRPRRKSTLKSNETLTETSIDSIKDLSEKQNERLTKNLNSSTNYSTDQIRISARRSSKASDRKEDSFNQLFEEKLEHPLHPNKKIDEVDCEKLVTNIKEDSRIQKQDNIKRTRRKLSCEKNEKQSDILSKSNLNSTLSSSEESKRIEKSSKIQIESEINTAKSSLESENDVHSENLSFAENETKLEKDLNATSKDSEKLTSQAKRSRRKLTTDKSEKNIDNSIETAFKSTQNLVEDVDTHKEIENCQIDETEHNSITRKSKQDKQIESLIKNKLYNVSNNESKNEKSKKLKDCSKLSAEPIVTKKLTSDNYSKRIEKLVNKNSDLIEKLVTKNDGERLEETPEIIKACTKSQAENIKRVARKSSPDKHERHTDNLEKTTLESVQSIEKSLEDLPKESHEIIKACSKSQTENQKRVTRKSSPDKHERCSEISMKINIDNVQNTFDGSDKALQKQNKINEDFKTTTENKRITRKSLNQQENSIKISSSPSDSPPISTEKINNTYTEPHKKIKECTKVQTENKRITRKSSLEKHDKKSEHVLANNLDSSQNSIHENNEVISETLDNKENSKAQIETNLKVAKYSSLKKDKHLNLNVNEKHVDSKDVANEENTEKPSEYLVSKLQPKSASEDSKKLRKSSIDKVNEINCNTVVNSDSDCSQSVTKDIVDKLQIETTTENQIKHKNDLIKSNRKNTRMWTKNNLQSQSSAESNTSNNQISTLTDVEDFIVATEIVKKTIAPSEILPKENSQNVQKSVSNENENNSKNLDDSCLMSIIASELDDHLIPEFCNMNYTNYVRNEINSEASYENQKQVTTDLFNEKENSIIDSNKIDSNLLEEIAIQSTEHYQNHSEEIFNEISKLVDNSFAEENQSNNLDGMDKHSTCRSIESSEKYDKIHENSMENFLRDTRIQQNMVEETSEIRAEDLDESIRQINIKSAENIVKNQQQSIHKNEILDYLVNEIDKAHSQDLVDDLENYFETSNQNNSNLNHNLENDNATDILSKAMLASDIIPSDYPVVDDAEDRNFTRRITRNSSNSGAINSESSNKVLNLLSSLDGTKTESTEVFAKQRRQITLQELKKKCTENLDRRGVVLVKKHCKDLIDESTSGYSPIDDQFTSPDNIVNLSEPSLDSCAEENFLESVSEGVDSDENPNDGRLSGFDMPPLNSSDDADSGVQTASEGRRHVDKIVLRCPRNSFCDTTNFHCKDCHEVFPSNRELKKHIKVQHRQRLVIKILKTDANKHVTQMVEPVVLRPRPHSDARGSVTNEAITEGDIKIIVKKESGSRNSHVVKEIKITPKAGASPAKSDLSGGSSTRIPAYSPAPSDLGSSISGGSSYRMPVSPPTRIEPTPPLKRGRGRPRKYPIFTESELEAKQLAALAGVSSKPVNSPTLAPTPPPSAPTPPPTAPTPPPATISQSFNNKNNKLYQHLLEPMFDCVESIKVPLEYVNEKEAVDVTTMSDTLKTKPYHEKEDSSMLKQMLESRETHDKPSAISTSEPVAVQTLEDVVQSVKELIEIREKCNLPIELEMKMNKKRKRKDSINSDSQDECLGSEVDDDEGTDREKKLRKIDKAVNENQSESDPSNFDDIRFCAKYNVTKELVVRLTKIDSVPKVNNQCNVDTNEVNVDTNDFSTIESEVKSHRKTKSKLVDTDEEEYPPCKPIRAIIRVSVRQKFESNNNNVNNAEKCLTVTNSLKRVQEQQDASTAEISGSSFQSAKNETTKSQEDNVIQSRQPPVGEPLNVMSKDSESPGNETSETPDDNQNTVSETQLVVTPRNQTIDKAESDENQSAKLRMIMNATTPSEPANNTIRTIVSNKVESPHTRSSLQTHPQTLAQSFTPPRPEIKQVPQSQPLPQTQTMPEAQPLPQTVLQHQATPQAQQQALFQIPPHLPGAPPIQVPPQLLQLQSQGPLLHMPSQPQQLCILFIPDTMYNADGTVTKDSAPTATLVNFQPVPDNEIANKPLIYTPTTPSKISIDEHSKSYVCINCTEVRDLIGRLEATLGMIDEDKSSIKCPYCSDLFHSLVYLEYHIMQSHLKCENESQCRQSGLNSLRIPTHETISEFEIYITFALKCRSCYDIFNTVLMLNDHVMHKHKTLVRIKPLATSSPSSTSVDPVTSSFTGFGRKNGIRHAVLQCPSDCVCRIGIRSTDSPLQRQQMLKRCPNAMRRLEKIEPAAYEVYTCTLCKSTFLMKDEVVDHLMKMHEVSCKFPCYTCLTSFRSLQMQENHRCSETTLQDIDKLLSIAILPVNVGSKNENKYPDREDSSTDEYTAIKSPPPVRKNGLKRKSSSTVVELTEFLKQTKKPKTGPVVNQQFGKTRSRKRTCPKCPKKFAYRKNLHDHIIYEHVFKNDTPEGPKKIVVELLQLISAGKDNTERYDELIQNLKEFNDDDSRALRSLLLNEDDNEDSQTVDNDANDMSNNTEVIQCSRCKTKIPANFGNLPRQNNHHLPNNESPKMYLCQTCDSIGLTTNRRGIVNNGQNPSCDVNAVDNTSQPLNVHLYTCKKCPATFPSAVDLKLHKRSEHLKSAEKPHVCDICKKTFTSPRMLEKHMKNHRNSLEDSPKCVPENENNRSTISTIDQDCSKNSNASVSLNDTNNSNRRDSSDCSSGGSKEPEEQPLNCSFCEEKCSSKVSLKNHLKREHGRRASICQFCNGLLIDTSEVRHMLDYHIVPSKSNPRRTIVKNNGSIFQCDESSCMQDDVKELVRTLGKQRLQSLMMYHDFEGKCNNAIMKCPMCPELFATRESCRFHYVWIHDDNCLLCDENFRSGSVALQHKVDTHTSTASYLWCIQRLVTAIVSTLTMDPDQPSHVLYQMLAMRLEEEEETVVLAHESLNTRSSAEKQTGEETASSNERFLEEVVLSEDQLPDSGNMIEVVIGKEDSEDDLLSMLNLSPSYESCEQPVIPTADAAPPEEEEEDEVNAEEEVQVSAPCPAPTALVPSSPLIASPPADTYVSSGVCKYRLENDEEQLVLVVTDEDLVTFRDDIGSLAERISATCDAFTLDEIMEMLKAYFDSVNGPSSSSEGT